MFWIPCAPEMLMDNPRMRDELWQYLLDLQRMPEDPKPALEVTAYKKCPGCLAGNLVPFDYRGLPMARCDTCGLEVNDATVEKWPSLDALHVHDPFSAVVAGFNVIDGEEKGEDREQK